MRLNIRSIGWLLMLGSMLPLTAASISMPIEIMGSAATEKSVTVSIPAGSTATELWIQAHNLSYQGKASVRVNGGTWINLRNDNPLVHVANPGKAHGGIGGGFMSLVVTVDLSSGALVNGSNTISFRFNETDGQSSGWRVLALNARSSNGTKLIADSAFVQDDPSAWTPPLSGASDITAGENVWNNAALIQKPGGSSIQARCASCHATDGRDLKYFNFSNHAIIERSKFHGLTQVQGQQIASYIRSLDQPAYGRPWNPPYQPGPGLDAKPVQAWAAGAGLDWVLNKDADVAAYLPGNGTDKAAHVDANRHFLTYNRREIPLAFQFLDWNHWLPEIHPMDAIGKSTFEAHGAWTKYLKVRQGLKGELGMTKKEYIFNQLRVDLDDWKASISGDDSRIPIISINTGGATTVENYKKTYAANLWSGTKLWEIMQEFQLEELGDQLYGLNGEKRQWFSNRHVFNFAPHIINNENTRDKLVVGDHDPLQMFNYLSDAWYEMQLILTPGGRNAVKGGHHDDDWKYLWYFVGASSEEFEAMQGLTLGWKSIQEIDNGWGPDGRDKSVQDNTWWGFSVRDARPDIGHILGTDDWPGFTRSAAKPYIQTIYSAYVEKVSTFSAAQWAKADPREFYRTSGYVWGSDNPGESIPDFMREELSRMGNIYQVDDALVNAYADWGKFMWPNNNWAQYRRALTGPTVPTGLSATAGVERVTVSWSAVTGATSYNVKRSESATGVYLPASLFVTGTRFVDPLLKPGKTWYYKVSANAGRGEGADSTSASATTTYGLVARWTFDETSGTRANDDGPFGLHGVLTSGPTHVSGKIGNALQTSDTSFVSVPLNIGRWLSGTSTMTAWIKTTATGNNTLQDAPTIMGCTQSDIFDGDRMMMFGSLDSSGRLGVRLNYYGPDVKSTNPVNDGTWHHVAITRDENSGTVKVYVDGGASASGDLQTGYLFKRTSSIGRADETRLKNYWQGGLDDVRMYNKVLNATEIQAIYEDRSTGGGGTPVNQAPTVAISAPTSGSTAVSPVSMTVTATAGDPDGSVSSVQFFDGTTVIGTDTTSPFSVTWATSTTGVHSLTAKATDNSGAVTTSAVVTVTVTAAAPVNQLPTVAITAPTAGSTFTTPVSMSITATAMDGDGTISKVEFYDGGTKIGTDTTSPYSSSWSPTGIGVHQLTAKATDNSGGLTTSAVVSVTILAPPDVGSGDGWLGRYFNSIDLTNPVLERRDATIDFNWGATSPDPLIHVDGFSVRWTGSLTAQFSETYTFTATTDDGVRLWVNGEQIINQWANQGPAPRTGSIALTAGASYDLKMEYYENSGGAEAHLQWSSASTPIGIIPATQISAPTPSVAPTISAIANPPGIVVGNSTAALGFTIGDADTAIGSLTVTRTSSNSTAVPLANVIVGGSGTTRTVAVTGAAPGSSTITVRVSDGDLSATATFVVTVIAAPAGGGAGGDDGSSSSATPSSSGGGGGSSCGFGTGLAGIMLSVAMMGLFQRPRR